MSSSLRRFPQSLEYAGGTDTTFTFPLYDTDNTDLAITGKTASFSLYKGRWTRGRRPFTGAALVIKTSAAGEIALTVGQAVVTIGNTDIPDYSGDFWWVLTITTTATGAVYQAWQGRMTVRKDT